MSLIGDRLQTWLGRNASTMHQEATVCEALPPNTQEQMIAISIDSAHKMREMGAAITHDYTLGRVFTGTRDKVLIPRPEGTIGTYHTHPFGFPFPGITDSFEAMNRDDRVTCVGATGKPGTKIQCFTQNEPRWSEFKARLNELMSAISEYNEKVGAKYKGTRAEIRLKITEKEPEWYRDGIALKKRRGELEEIIRAELRSLAAPKEWTGEKWVNGFEEVPYFEAYPNMFNKCRVIWEELEEELPYEL